MEENVKKENQPPSEGSITQTPPAPETPKPKPKLKRLVLVIGILFALLIICIVTINVLVSALGMSRTIDLTVPPLSPAPNPTESWDIYNDGKFTFSYPSSWRISKFIVPPVPSETAGIFNLSPQYVYSVVEISNPKNSGEYVRIDVFPANISTQEAINKIENKRITKQLVFITPSPSLKVSANMEVRNININGIPAQTYFSDTSWNTLVSSQGKLIDISLGADTNKNTNSIEDKILSSFKLIDKPAKNTFDWNTYTNTKYGYSIDYPADKYTDCSDGESFRLVEGKEGSRMCAVGEEFPVIMIGNSQEGIGDIQSTSNPNCYSRKKETIMINGISADKYSSVFNDTYECNNSQAAYSKYLINLVFNKGSVPYVITFNEGSDKDFKNRIVSTFKFTKPDTLDSEFSLEYPQDWSADTVISDDGIGIYSLRAPGTTSQSILVETRNDNLSNLEYIYRYVSPNSSPRNVGKANINGLIGEKWTFNHDTDDDNYAIFLDHNNKKYALIKEISNKSHFQSLNSQIDTTISTFKFTR